MRENHDRRLHKAHVELSIEMQNLKGGKGKCVFFYQRESCVRMARQHILRALREMVLGIYIGKWYNGS